MFSVWQFRYAGIVLKSHSYKPVIMLCRATAVLGSLYTVLLKYTVCSCKLLSFYEYICVLIAGGGMGNMSMDRMGSSYDRMGMSGMDMNRGFGGYGGGGPGQMGGGMSDRGSGSKAGCQIFVRNVSVD